LGVAWSTCDGKPKSQACEYKGFHGESYIGTCQVMANNMLCVRNQPIQYPEGVAKEAHTERTKAGEAADVANQNVKEHVIKKGVSKQAEAVTPQGLSEPVEAAAAGSAPTNKQ